MILSVGGLQAWLDSDSAEINSYWKHLLGDLLTEKTDQTPDVRLQLEFVEGLPPKPNIAPFFTHPTLSN